LRIDQDAPIAGRKIESVESRGKWMLVLLCLTRKAQEYLRANVTDQSKDGIVTYTGFRRTTRRTDPGARLWVYARRNQPCRRCGAPIQSRKQGEAARVTFWCPRCQPL
jgi:endonuclease-8